MAGVDAVRDKIDRMIGLDTVKEEIDTLVNGAVVDANRYARGKPVGERNWNMVFAGPSGTGKTTVAEHIAPLFHSLGITENDRVVVKTADDLKSRFKGGSAAAAKAVMEEARGGVLFIDEAYQLVSSDNDDYGNEAIAAILPMLTDPKTVVILGGYEDEMRKMIASNTGLSSRFGRTLHFESYTAEERAEIMVNIFDKSGFALGKGAGNAISSAVLLTGGGNARDVLRLSERVVDAYNARAVESGVDDDVITLGDVREGAAAYEVGGAPDVRLGDAVKKP